MALWYVQSHKIRGVSIFLFNGYSLLEALFFFWLIRHLALSRLLRKVTGYFLYATPVAGALVLILPVLQSGKVAQSVPFVAWYEVSAAFLAGFALLFMAEHDNDLTGSWKFWFISGVFFYCFGTFFFMFLLGNQLSLNLWPLNNIVNILTYILYALGWWKYPSGPGTGQLAPHISRH